MKLRASPKTWGARFREHAEDGRIGAALRCAQQRLGLHTAVLALGARMEAQRHAIARLARLRQHLQQPRCARAARRACYYYADFPV